MRTGIPTRRRLVTIVSGLFAAAVLASSCSLDAAVETDSVGRVIGISALRIQSGALDLAFALALAGHQLILELRWHRDPAETSPFF